MPTFLFASSPVPDPRTHAEKLHDVMLELDHLIHKMVELKDEVTLIWEDVY